MDPEEENEQGTEGTEEIDKKLPIEQLLLLFSYFPIDILVRVQRVCSTWRVASHHKSLWKNFTLTISGKTEDEKYIRTMPALRNIDGYADNNFINIILESVTELSRMNCKFQPPIPSSQMQMLITKYPELKSITVDILALDILQTVHVLKTSKYLEEIIFTSTGNDRVSFRYNYLSDLSKLYTVLLDDSSFTALTRIDISVRSRFCNCLPNATSESSSCIVDVIKKKSPQLSSLKFTANKGACKNYAEAVNACTQLHTLQLSLCRGDECNNKINIENMTHLKSLSLDTGRFSTFLPTLRSSLYKGSWVHMREVNLRVFTDHKRKIEILRSVIENMKQLKMLRYCDDGKNTSEKELKGISSLLHLKKLVIDGLTEFSGEGVNYISQCKSLEYLLLKASRSAVDKWNIANMANTMIKLERMVVGNAETCIFLACRQEINEFISKNKSQVL